MFQNRKVLPVDITKVHIQIALKILVKTTSAPAAKECLNKSIWTAIGSGPESFKANTQTCASALEMERTKNIICLYRSLKCKM